MSDAEDFGMGRPAPLFDAPVVGPFDRSKITPGVDELVVGGMIWRHRGRANAIPLAKLMEVTGKDERQVRGIVQQLVVSHRMRIGAWERGYYMIEDAADLEAAIARPTAQIFAMWGRLRVLLDPHALAELHGQLSIEE